MKPNIPKGASLPRAARPYPNIHRPIRGGLDASFSPEPGANRSIHLNVSMRKNIPPFLPLYPSTGGLPRSLFPRRGTNERCNVPAPSLLFLPFLAACNLERSDRRTYIYQRKREGPGGAAAPERKDVVVYSATSRHEAAIRPNQHEATRRLPVVARCRCRRLVSRLSFVAGCTYMTAIVVSMGGPVGPGYPISPSQAAGNT